MHQPDCQRFKETGLFMRPVARCFVWFLFAVASCMASLLHAQNHLSVNYTSAATVPDHLNVCGAPDTVRVTISLAGQSPLARTQITATCHLFSGIQFVGIDAAATSTGVALLEDDAAAPVFSIPDLSPDGLTLVHIGLIVRADCGIVDTLAQNGMLEVFDQWQLDYLLDGQPITEFDATAEYRDALAVPFFTLQPGTPPPPARPGDCLSRQIVVSNSALNGSTDTLWYTATEGTGLSVYLIEANGIPLDFQKTVGPFGDTVLTAVLAGAVFEANSFGNGDTTFDPDEALTIVEHYCVVDCAGGTESTHSVGWGCDGSICAESAVIDFVPLGEGTPKAVFSTGGALPDVHAGYCTPGQTTITLTNDGIEFDAGFGAMYDLWAGIGLGGTFSTEDGRLRITDLRIAGVDVVPPAEPLVALHGHPAFAADPDGDGGLDDLDGDGWYDDLPVGASLEITAFYEADCSTAGQTDPDNSCANDFGTSFNGRVRYTDACGQTTTHPFSNFFRPANSRISFSNQTPPDAFMVTDTFVLRHHQNRSLRFFEWTCGGAEHWTFTAHLPKGVQPVIGQVAWTHTGGEVANLTSWELTDTVLTLVFDASAISTLQGEFDLVLPLTADCSAPLGKVAVPLTIDFACPDCGCVHRWYCGTLPGPQLHAASPPCPPEVLACDSGLRTWAFSAERTTFGFADADLTTPIAPQQANKKVAINCDSVALTVRSVVGDAPLSDSIGVVITYANPDGTASTDELFLFGEGHVRIVNSGITFTCPVDASRLQLATEGSRKELRFDLSSCLTGLGLTLQPGDSIDFRGVFQLNPEGPYDLQFRQVPDFRAWAFARIDGQDRACDNFGETFRVARTRTVFNFPNSSAFPEGCEATTLDYRLLTINNGFSTWFGNEYREAMQLDSMVIDFDPALLLAFADKRVEVSIPGHPVHGDDYFALPPLDSFPDGHYVARFDTLELVPLLNVVQSHNFHLRLRLVPLCQTATAGSQGDGIFDFAPRIYYRDRLFARHIGDGSCVAEVSSTAGTLLVYDKPPALALTPLSHTQATLATDTAEWTVQVCNTSTEASTGFVWLALDDPALNATPVQVFDITDPDTAIAVPLIDDSPGRYWLSGPLQPANIQSGYAEICRVFRVRAVVDACVPWQGRLVAGWGCTDSPPTGWSPRADSLCAPAVLPVSLLPQNPFLDADMVDQPATNPDICDTTTLTILLRNTDRGTAFDLITDLFIPLEGATLVPGSVQLAWPSSAPFQPAGSDPIFVGSTVRGRHYRYEGFDLLHAGLATHGLPGFDPDSPSDSNELRLRFSFVTDCTFRSGSLAYYHFQAHNGCGDPSNFEAGESFPLLIAGAEPPLDQVYEIQTDPPAVLIPQDTTTLILAVRKLTTAPADTSARITIILPEGVTYVPGSTQRLDAAIPMPEPESSMQGTIQTLRWPLPPDMEEGQAVRIAFRVMSPAFDCALTAAEAVIAVVLHNELFCASEGISCEVETIVSTGGAQIVTMPVSSNVQLELSHLHSTCADTAERVRGQAAFTSNDLALAGKTFTLELLYDANGNGQPDSLDLLIASWQAGPLAGNSDTIAWEAPVPPAQACGLLLVARTDDAEVCGLPWTPVAPPPLELAPTQVVSCGPGPDTIEIASDSCAALQSYDIVWQTVGSPAGFTWLDSTGTTARFVLTHDQAEADTLLVLASTARPGCAPSGPDTLRVLRSPALVLDLPTTLFVLPGDSLALPLALSGGLPPYSIAWTPDSTLSDPSALQPLAFPDTATTYGVTVTDAAGCANEAAVLVLLQNPVAAAIVPADTAVCAGMPVTLAAAGGDQFVWFEDDANPITGLLSADSGAEVPFLAQAAGSYTIGLIATDSAYPGFADTAFAKIEVLARPDFAIGLPDSVCAGWNHDLTLLTAADTVGWTIHWQPAPLAGQGTATARYVPTDTMLVVATVTTAAGCTAADTAWLYPQSCDCSVAPADTFFAQAPTCGQPWPLCLDIGSDALPRYAFTLDSQPWTNALDACAFEFRGVYTWAALFGQGQAGTYLVESWPVGTDTFSFSFQSIAALVDSMNLFDPDGHWQPDPAGGPFIIGGVQGQHYGPMTVEVVSLNLTNTLGFNEQYLPTAFAIPLDPGAHVVVATDTATGCSDTLRAWVFCTTTDTLVLEWPVTREDSFCLSANGELPAPPDTFQVACSGTDLATLTPLSDTCLWLSPQAQGTDTFCLVQCDALGICDTTVVVLQITPEPAIVLTDTILIGQQATWCADTALLDLGGSPATLTNVCPSLSGNEVSFVTDALCLTYTGLQLGTDTACLAFCDSMGLCDTLFFTVTVVPGQTIYDTIRLDYDTGLWCFDTSGLVPPIAWQDLCAASHGQDVAFVLDPATGCLSWSGLQPGTDTTCIMLSDSSGKALLTRFIVTVVDIRPATVCDTVFVGMTKHFCLDTTELPGNFSWFDDACATLNDEHVDFFFLPDSLCVEYTGLGTGRDSACFVLCDDQGFCDTTYFCIAVEPYPGPPIAHDDLFCTPGTPMGTPVVLDVLANDTIFGGLQHIEIVEQPASGDAVAILNLDRSITLIPSPPFCARVESFTYRVCNPNTCDTATVQVCIECLDVQPFTAVSPNNDGYNDTFYIGRIEDFPDNHLRIYNRWGNLVFETRGYKNDWPGIWNEDKALPDGTYFFILEYDDRGETKVLRGFFELFR